MRKKKVQLVDGCNYFTANDEGGRGGKVKSGENRDKGQLLNWD